ncbi:MFS general substrate transporter [Coniophora puteana RWD-64-598 SS2]|uniref:MFS general substrate transporter n=1 Tax=Coniophora puteana (strain RWD-64-598) TaxID=741705 RepID=A0A5M3N335_CONPW|nr:MFS general substrate transporter [Coniophora puteana RWD-64-598 SS2]EIW85697.1 MFS general substrate transporter [Coniophora puteana RWD-64-598 SS2]
MSSKPVLPPPDNVEAERRPLLAQRHQQAEAKALHDATHEVIYQRFSPSQKTAIVAIVSVGGFLPLFIPSVPEIARDIDSTGPAVSFTGSLSILATALGSLMWSGYSTYYGRRAIYFAGLHILVVGSVGVAAAQTLPQLLVWRFVQAFGCAGGFPLGSGVIGDIYKLEERGTASLLAPAIAPLVGGIAAEYSSWRILQLILGLWGCLEYVPIWALLPETSHPGKRGIDKVPEGERSGIMVVNPIAGLGLMRSPNLFFVSVAGSAVLLTSYVLLVPLAYTVGVRYNITSSALVGACFLPSGLGSLTGAPLGGRVSDIIVRRWRKCRGGEWVLEDRLRAAWVGGVLLAPLSVETAGLVTEYVDGTIGLVLVLVCLFTNGIGVDFVLSHTAAYGVDLIHSRSAEIIAASSALHNLIMAAATAVILPSVERFGVAATNIGAAVLAWLGYGFIHVTIRYGKQLRAFSLDVGYSTL